MQQTVNKFEQILITSDIFLIFFDTMASQLLIFVDENKGFGIHFSQQILKVGRPYCQKMSEKRWKLSEVIKIWSNLSTFIKILSVANEL